MALITSMTDAICSTTALAECQFTRPPVFPTCIWIGEKERPALWTGGAVWLRTDKKLDKDCSPQRQRQTVNVDSGWV